MNATVGTTLQLDLIDTNGEPRPIRPERATFLYFMRAPTCPQCNNAVRRLAEQQSSLRERGVEVVVAMPTGTEEAAAWKSAKNVPFDVVTGRAGTAHEEAGLLRRVFGLIQQSGGILVDGAGSVQYLHIATNPGDSLRLRELDDAIDALASRL